MNLNGKQKRSTELSNKNLTYVGWLLCCFCPQFGLHIGAHVNGDNTLSSNITQIVWNKHTFIIQLERVYIDFSVDVEFCSKSIYQRILHPIKIHTER